MSMVKASDINKLRESHLKTQRELEEQRIEKKKRLILETWKSKEDEINDSIIQNFVCADLSVKEILVHDTYDNEESSFFASKLEELGYSVDVVRSDRHDGCGHLYCVWITNPNL